MEPKSLVLMNAWNACIVHVTIPSGCTDLRLEPETGLLAIVVMASQGSSGGHTSFVRPQHLQRKHQWQKAFILLRPPDASHDMEKWWHGGPSTFLQHPLTCGWGTYKSNVMVQPIGVSRGHAKAGYFGVGLKPMFLPRSTGFLLLQHWRGLWRPDPEFGLGFLNSLSGDLLTNPSA